MPFKSDKQRKLCWTLYRRAVKEGHTPKWDCHKFAHESAPLKRKSSKKSLKRSSKRSSKKSLKRSSKRSSTVSTTIMKKICKILNKMK
jgi:hypothetical protein